MLYEINNGVREIRPGDIDPARLTVGYVTVEELETLGVTLGFDPETVDACRNANPYFRTGVDVEPNYTFSELRIVTGDDDDCIALYLMKNLILVVDVLDVDGSTRNTFMKCLRNTNPAKLKAEKLVCSFIEALLSGDAKTIERMRIEMSVMEEAVIGDKTGDDFASSLLDIKKRLLKLHNYYEQILDIAETLDENDNDVFNYDDLIPFTNLSNKVSRLKADIDSLQNLADHLQDAYNSLLDQKLNHTMKIFTVITTIFFPLTIIVGWYGMNFKYMPELNWKLGYLFVAILSAVIVAVLVWIFKKKKWF